MIHILCNRHCYLNKKVICIQVRFLAGIAGYVKNKRTKRRQKNMNAQNR